MNINTNSHLRATRRLGFAGAAMGLLAAPAISAIRLGLINVNPGPPARPGPSVEMAGNLSFTLAFTMPFALALLALWLREPAQRAAIWLGVGALALMTAVAPISIATFLLLPLPGILLVVAALLTLNEVGSLKRTRVLGAAAAVAIIGGAAGVALFSLPDPTCWELVRSADGQDMWRVIPYTTSLTVGPAPGPVAASCSSDIISPIEAMLSAGAWILGLIGLRLALPRVLPREG